MKFTNKYNLPEFVFKALTKNYYNGDPSTISATALINSPRYVQLHKRHDSELEEEISDNVWKVFGSAVHLVFEDSAVECNMTESEERLVQEVFNIKISGQFDVLHGTSIYDYKTTSVWSVIYNDQKKWTQQLNIYKWLSEKNGKPVKDLKVIAIFRDWRRGEAEKSPEDYPQIPIKVYDIPVIDDIESFIKERVLLHSSCLYLPDDELPVCTPEDRWQSETTYAVYKNTNKTAMRVLKIQEEADKLMEGMSKQYPKEKFTLQIRTGFDRRCKNYCLAKHFCNYWKEKYGGENC